MTVAFFLLFVAAGLFFVLIDQALFAGLFFLGALFIGLSQFLSKAGKASKATAGALTKGVVQEVSKAETSGFEPSVAEEGIKNVADLTGQQTFAKDKYQFKFKGFSAIGEACQRLIDLFKRVFK